MFEIHFHSFAFTLSLLIRLLSTIQTFNFLIFLLLREVKICKHCIVAPDLLSTYSFQRVSRNSMPSCCSLPTCHSRANKKCKKQDISFFRFPKNKAIREAWLQKCGRADELNLDNAAICSKHFSEDDYDPSYLVKKALLPNVLPRLKSDAIPSLNLTAVPR